MTARLPLLSFALVFGLGLLGAGFTLWRYFQVRDEVVANWDGPGAVEVRLDPGLYRVWLRQDPAGDNADITFEAWWKQGWQLRPVELVDGVPRGGGVQYGPLNGTTRWRGEAQQPVSVGAFTIDQPQHLQVTIAQANPYALPGQQVKLWLARASYAQRNQLLLMSLGWFGGGLLGSCLTFAVVAGLQTPGETKRAATSVHSRSRNSR